MEFYNLKEASKDPLKVTKLTVTFSYSAKFPLEVLKMTNLEELRLSRIGIKSIPPRIDKLKKLRLLRIEDWLQQIPPEIVGLEALEVLAFWGTGLKELPDFILQIPKLRILDISKSPLEKLPDNFGDCPQLEEFVCFETKLTELPDSLQKCKLLKRLVLKNSGLKSVPHWSEKLEELNELYLTHMGLTQIPSFVYGLKELEILSLRDNALEELSSKIGTLTQLKRLILVANRLTKLPDAIGKLENLENLDLQSNQLSELPKSLGNCTKLQSLNIGFNAFTKFPDIIQKLTNIDNLRFKKNAIKVLPDWLGKLTKLAYLDGAQNQLKSLPDVFDKFPDLERINLPQNQLEELPPSLAKEGIEGWIAYNPFKKRLPFEAVYWKSASLGGTPMSVRLYQESYTFYKTLENNKIEGDSRLSVYHILTNTNPEAGEIPLADLFLALHHKWENLSSKIYARAQRILAERHEESRKQNPLKKGEEVAVLGTIAMKKAELRDRLKEFGAAYSTKIKKTTKHIVIGKGIKNYEGFDRSDIIFWTDSLINESLQQVEKPFLLEQTEDNADSIINMSALLLSQVPENVELGLEMLKKAGTPLELLTDLFLIIKNPNLPAPIRKQAKNALDLYNNPRLKALMQGSKYPIIRSEIREDKLYDNILAYTYDSPLDKRKMGRYIFEAQGNGLRFWFSQLNAKERKATLDQILKDKPDILVEGLWFKEVSEIFKFPQIKRLMLEKARFRTFPEELLQFKDLEYLDLSRNTIKELPDSFKQLDKLQTLILSYNKLKTYPKVIEEMPNLKQIITHKLPFMALKKTGVNTDIYKVHYRGLVRK